MWFFLLGIPLAALGAAAVLAPRASAAVLRAFPRHRLSGRVLCAFAWLWTAYELDNMGIEVFDRYLKAFPGELWILAVVLTVLTCLWMENLLPVRGVCAVFMLFPAELFPTVRLCDTRWRLALVVFAYLCAVTGMIGMFYPWHLRRLIDWLTAEVRRTAVAGMAALATGAAFLVLGVLASLGAIR